MFSVMITIVENKISDPSSNPGENYLFIFMLIPLGKAEIIYSPYSYG